jgi:hypothetical protein
MADWTLAGSLVTLRNEFDRAHPNRPKASDGTIGDPAHQARVSDHNPDANGVVRAWDCTALDETQPHPLAVWIAANKPSRVKYVISRGRIMKSYASSSGPAWTWLPYTGINGHFHHCHVSVTAAPFGDDPAPWGYPGGIPKPVWRAPAFPGYTLRLGQVSDNVRTLKYLLVAAGFGDGLAMSPTSVRVFGPGTAKAVQRLAAAYYRANKVTPPATLPSSVGPKLWAFLCDCVRLAKARAT